MLWNARRERAGLPAARKNSGLLAWLTVLAISSVESTANADKARGRDESAQDDIEHTIVLGIGAATELELGDGSMHPGGNLMVEWQAIENLLEFELGVSVLAPSAGSHFGSEGVQVPIDLLVKKPFRVTRQFEFMLGLGPQLVQIAGGNGGTYFGGEFALDLMLWPAHQVGVWLEPDYDFVVHQGVSHGLGTTGGLLLGW